MSTDTAEPSNRVDQIVFTWSDRLLLGGSGLGPVAGSLTQDKLRVWNERLLGGDVAVGQWIHGAPECVALGALRFGRRWEQGAVLRLLPTRDPNGRSSQLVHALVGDAAWVNSLLALGLHDWPGWMTPERLAAAAPMPPSLEPLHAGELWAHAQQALAALPVLRDPLAGLLAGALAAPADSYLAGVGTGDYGLLAGFVRRLEGMAGTAPWTMMLGAEVTRSEARPRLLVLDHGDARHLRDARRDRTALNTAGSAAPQVTRAAGLLADLPVSSLTRPRAPLEDTALLVDWVEAEYQRASTILDLLDRAIAGTLDEPARRHLEGAAGRERLREELRPVGMPELADRLNRWAAARPRGLGEAGRTLRQIGAERYLADAGRAREAAEQLVEAARRMGTTSSEAARILAGWRAGLADITPTHRYDAVYFALHFGVDPRTDPTVGELLSGMPAIELLRWSAELAPAGHTGLAVHFMHTAHRRWSRARGQMGDESVRELLRETGTFHETIHRLVQAENLKSDDETDLYRIVLHLAYGAPLSDFQQVLAALPSDAAATEFRPWLALAGVLESRTAVFEVAADACARGAQPVVLEELLHRFTGADLIATLAGRDWPPQLIGQVFRVLNARPHPIDERLATRETLVANGFLFRLVESAWPTPEHRLGAYTTLLKAGYKPGDRQAGQTGLSAADAEKLLALNGPQMFVWAILDAAGEDAVLPVLVHGARRHMDADGVSPARAAQIVRGPHHRVVKARRPEPALQPATVPGAPPLQLPSADYQTPVAPAFGPNGGTQRDEPSAGAQPDSFASDDQQEPPPDDRTPIVAWLASMDRRRVLGVISALVLVVILLYMLFSLFNGGSGGSGDDPAPARPTVTVTVTTSPSTPGDEETPNRHKSKTPSPESTPSDGN